MDLVPQDYISTEKPGVYTCTICSCLIHLLYMNIHRVCHILETFALGPGLFTAIKSLALCYNSSIILLGNLV